ncbi:hypothetical protein CBM2586_A50061 [Cupriavidus phytorum]|uniref:Uncharacterized protein n=1 Tax=Cupriavidus taiwanensis TaxID=164546 RepID=A0A976A4S7_9BURK|nr:hypothetical protein CBM2586_A50061 [Cupriavidus taiwanensis]
MTPLVRHGTGGACPLVCTAAELNLAVLTGCARRAGRALFCTASSVNDRRSLWLAGLHLQGAAGVFAKFPIPPSEWKRIPSQRLRGTAVGATQHNRGWHPVPT